MYRPYKDLTDQQKKLIGVMYFKRDDLEDYLYNFEGDRYRGRTPAQKQDEPDPEIVEEVKPKRTRRK